MKYDQNQVIKNGLIVTMLKIEHLEVLLRVVNCDGWIKHQGKPNSADLWRLTHAKCNKVATPSIYRKADMAKTLEFLPDRMSNLAYFG